MSYKVQANPRIRGQLFATCPDIRVSHCFIYPNRRAAVMPVFSTTHVLEIAIAAQLGLRWLFLSVQQQLLHQKQTSFKEPSVKSNSRWSFYLLDLLKNPDLSLAPCRTTTKRQSIKPYFEIHNRLIPVFLHL